MADCFLAGAVATGCDYEVERDRAAVRRTGAGHVAGRRLPRRDGCGWAGPRCGEEVEAPLPLGSTDMGNVTQVMPGIHPSSGSTPTAHRCTSPASPRRPPAPAATRPSSRARSCWRARWSALAETPAERDRVLELQAKRVAVMRLAGRRRALAGRALRRPGGVAPAHPRATPNSGARSSPPRSSSPPIWPTPGSTRRCCPAAPGLICDFGPEHGPRIALRADMDALADGRAHRRALRVGGARTSRTPAVTTRTPRCCSARRWRWRRCPNCRSACG